MFLDPDLSNDSYCLSWLAFGLFPVLHFDFRFPFALILKSHKNIFEFVLNLPKIFRKHVSVKLTL